MNKILPFPTLVEQSAPHRVDALPEGIRITLKNAGDREKNTDLLTFEEALSRLDSDFYDREWLAGIQVLRALTDAVIHGYFKPSDRQQLILWRWFVSVKFVLDQEQVNGHINVSDGKGGEVTATLYRGKYGSIPIYPWSERSAIASVVESGLVECYGAEEGIRNALTFYVTMIDFSTGELTDIGRGVMTTLHDRTIQEIKMNGFPPTPTAH
ncbi:hypothetical protein KSL88_18800 [Pectobacterium polaris]|uniref:hypothetical protein n=1 Tax=Pectobacterium polaris TaxID=2042057 RepID=UPI001CC7271D|nr:hypothetical protein [Pectobacterium polaris]UAY90413.1 hypothetical protein KSL88_12760 [Pectobacterium polaris]UAY91511.1 hypothetical protein KSL88_18800 [Pectobacterium polaris]